MSHRLHKLAAATGLALLAQAGSAAPILTQSVNFCLGVCDVAIVANAPLKATGDGVFNYLGSATTGAPVTLTKTDSTTRNFNTFNTSLGILTKVSFTLTSIVRIGLNGGASDGSGNDALTSMTLDPSITLVSLGSLLDDPDITPLTLSDLGYFATKVSSADRNASVSKAPPDDLSFFTNGSSFAAQFQQDLKLETVADCSTTVGNARWEGTLELQYEYEERPTTVPEPGTLLLVGTGLLSAVAGLRRRTGARLA